MMLSGSGVISSSNFYVSEAGNITGSSALFDGSIYVTGTGTIAGFTLNSSEIKDASQNLLLKSSGQITGSQVLFTGGHIGNWILENGYLVDSSNILKLDPNNQYIVSSSDFQISNYGEITASAGLVGG